MKGLARRLGGDGTLDRTLKNLNPKLTGHSFWRTSFFILQEGHSLTIL